MTDSKEVANALSFVFYMMGVGFVCGGAFMISRPVGMIVLGVMLLLLAFAVRDAAQGLKKEGTPSEPKLKMFQGTKPPIL